MQICRKDTVEVALQRRVRARAQQLARLVARLSRILSETTTFVEPTSV